MKRNTIILLVAMAALVIGIVWYTNKKKAANTNTGITYPPTNPPVVDNPTNPTTGFSTDPVTPEIMA